MAVVLLILDGWGNRCDADDNAISLANTPNWDGLLKNNPHTLIKTDGLSVGLPSGQAGNSEVGHMNIGAGRVVYQNLTRINLSAQNNFADNQLLNEKLTNFAGDLHLLALLSEGGVHSHQDHVFALINLAIAKNINKIVVHAFLDGRDTLPKSAFDSLSKLAKIIEQYPQVVLADISGRYFAMDRDSRWERTAKIYDLLVNSRASYCFDNWQDGLNSAYERGEVDEFVQPTLLNPNPIKNNDGVIFVNFRSDRARQLTQMLTDANFNYHPIADQPKTDFFITMTCYNSDFNLPVAFLPQEINDTLGEVVANAGFKQFRTAETEKYPHVTYFFNGGIEKPYEGEVRKVVPSPKVSTYDLCPQMSIHEVTDELISAINSKKYELIVANFANPDMVGHTGVLSAAIKAVEAVDMALGRVISAVNKMGDMILVTADHGNCEQMVDQITNQPHTSHTNNLVSLVYQGKKPAILQEGGALCDIAPTLLSMMNLTKPSAMTGKSLINFLPENNQSKQQYVYLNDQFLPSDKAKISVFDRGFLMADAIYEVSAVVNGKMLDNFAHFQRLERSAKQLDLIVPVDYQQFLAIQEELIQKNQLVEGLIYCQLTRGACPRDFVFKAGLTPTLLFFTQEKALIDDFFAKNGLHITLANDIRWLRRDIKTTQLLAQSMAKTNAKKTGFDDVWFFDEKGFITEGSSSNAWIIKDNKAITRFADHHILNGITRNTLWKIIEKGGYLIDETGFSVDMLLNADGAFATSATGVVVPIVKVNNQLINKGKIPQILRDWRSEYFSLLA